MSEAGSGAPAPGLEDDLGHRFASPALLQQALTHASYAHESQGEAGHDRLEFLGDAVIDLVLAHALFARHPDWHEGELTLARKELVNAGALAARARAMDLGRHARLGRSELRGGGADKDTVLSDLFEALVGALYLDGGLPVARGFVERCFAAELETARPGRRDAKTLLQEWAHAERNVTPRYRLVADSGVDQDEGRFESEVLLHDQPVARGVGRSKRTAEQAAAAAALEVLRPGDG